MEELNSLSAKKLSPIDRMKKLQKAILLADNKVMIKSKRISLSSKLIQGVIFIPSFLYVVYHLVHPKGWAVSFQTENHMTMYAIQLVLKNDMSLMKFMRPEIYYKLHDNSLKSVEYTPSGSQVNLISNAFAQGKKNGDEAVKNYIPYLWQ